MSKRVLVTPGRIIISKVGFDASPSLDDGNKVFDSNWGFGGAILAVGTFIDPSTPMASPNQIYTRDLSNLVINFDDPGYIPAAYCMAENNQAVKDTGHSLLEGDITGGGGFRALMPVQGTIGRGTITIQRYSTTISGGPATKRFPLGIHYIVFAIA